ncbi:hypothetical protein [Wolbachia endosymbiont of Brugia pahangi]|uniref:hypothetical protein n=1 Tax=Wolbachia endosymbiont of Brugia pahangi TaxID=96495 RepID=UPI0014356ACD|nr:hypothetical protein [Wolbachia endosymbiont of Brugia pahangi]QIT36313.1 hypothetical protein WBP_1028 [Wolbachia endosymbiont of Brugia pahangi]
MHDIDKQLQEQVNNLDRTEKSTAELERKIQEHKEEFMKKEKKANDWKRQTPCLQKRTKLFLIGKKE